MSALHRSRPLMLATVVLVASTLFVPVTVNAEEQIIADEPVLVAEEQVLALAAVVGPSRDETSGYDAVESGRATIGHPAVSATAQANQVLTADQALQSHDLGSLQKEALMAVVAAMTWDETSGYGAVETNRAEPAKYGAAAAGTTDEAALLAQFRAVELSLSRYLGAEHSMPTPCDIIY
jgi:hypothetical protein